MKRWLGIPVFEKEHVCVACNKEAMDIFGNHAIVCSTKGDRIKRHNAIRDCFFDFCSAAAWGPVKEKPFLLPGSCKRSADILIPNYSAGKDLLLILLSRALCNLRIYMKQQIPAFMPAISMLRI